MATGASETYAEHTVRSFRDDAIRTAVLIDDEFPSYAEADDGYREAERARALYTYFHELGLVCDVHNLQSGPDDLGSMAEKLRKSDLVVLEYHLKDKGEKSLGILRSLAESAHFNLVVLYTAEPSLPAVALRAAAVMHGAPPLDERPELPAGDEDMMTDAIVEAGLEPTFGQLADFVTTGAVPWMRDACDIVADDTNDIGQAETRRIADMIGSHHLGQLLDQVELSSVPLETRYNVEGDGPLWVQAGRSFVAILKKRKPESDDAGERQNEGQMVWDYLSEALLSWKPNFYRLMLSEIQNALELDALGSSQDWLDDELCLGLGMYLFSTGELEGEGGIDENAVAGKVEDLTDRFVDIIRRKLSVHEQVGETGRQVFRELLDTAPREPQQDETVRHERARLFAGYPEDERAEWEKDILPRVNAFMVSDAFRGSHVTTGTVIFDERADKYFLCTSPACDLVPGRAPNPMSLQVAELSMEKGDGQNTSGEKIMFERGGGVVTCRVLASKTKQIKLTHMLLPNGTTTRREGDGRHKLDAIFLKDMVWDEGRNDEGGPHGTATLVTVEVVAQLRRGFAERYLNEAGKQLSRIGVDFVDLADQRS